MNATLRTSETITADYFAAAASALLSRALPRLASELDLGLVLVRNALPFASSANLLSRCDCEAFVSLSDGRAWRLIWYWPLLIKLLWSGTLVSRVAIVNPAATGPNATSVYPMRASPFVVGQRGLQPFAFARP